MISNVFPKLFPQNEMSYIKAIKTYFYTFSNFLTQERHHNITTLLTSETKCKKEKSEMRRKQNQNLKQTQSKTLGLLFGV